MFGLIISDLVRVCIWWILVEFGTIDVFGVGWVLVGLDIDCFKLDM